MKNFVMHNDKSNETLSTPIRFKPYYKQVLWGGERIAELKNENLDIHQLGESWEISAHAGCESVVDSDDTLKGLKFSDLISRYGKSILGRRVLSDFGTEFPLIIKIIDAKQDLSIQVHPDSKFEKNHPEMPQKNEMWYIIDSKPDAKIICGFNKDIDPDEFENHISGGEILKFVKTYKSQPGQLFYIPAGTIHAIGAGNLIAEIQQASDTTFRVYDYNRVDSTGNKRELHVELAGKVLNFSKEPEQSDNGKILYSTTKDIIKNPYFKVDFLNLDTSDMHKMSLKGESFVILLAVEGCLDINYANSTVSCSQGNAILIPASIADFTVSGKGKALLTYY